MHVRRHCQTSQMQVIVLVFDPVNPFDPFDPFDPFHPFDPGDPASLLLEVTFMAVEEPD